MTHKPNDHYRPEQFPDFAGAMTLTPKKEKQDQAGQGEDQWLGLSSGHFQTFQGGEDGDNRSNETIPIQQRRTKEPS